jgi:hypothetical protein
MSLFDASFFKRLGFYLVGLSLGLVFLAFFFKEKRTEFCYMPNCRVLKDLRSKPLYFDERTSKMLLNKEIDTTDLTDFFVEGNVLFNSSDTKREPCKLYLIEGKLNSKDARLEVENCPDQVVIKGIR